MKKRTSELKTAKQQTGRCPETLPSSPYREERAASCICPPPPPPPPPLVLPKTSIVTKKPVVVKRRIFIYVRVCVCVCVAVQGCFCSPLHEAQLFSANLKPKEI